MSKATHPERARRRADALTRQAKRNARTANEQIAELATRPGASKRETARLSQVKASDR